MTARNARRVGYMVVGAFACGAICLAVAGSFLDRADFILAEIGFLALEFVGIGYAILYGVWLR